MHRIESEQFALEAYKSEATELWNRGNEYLRESEKQLPDQLSNKVEISNDAVVGGPSPLHLPSETGFRRSVETLMQKDGRILDEKGRESGIYRNEGPGREVIETHSYRRSLLSSRERVPHITQRFIRTTEGIKLEHITREPKHNLEKTVAYTPEGIKQSATWRHMSPENGRRQATTQWFDSEGRGIFAKTFEETDPSGTGKRTTFYAEPGANSRKTYEVLHNGVVTEAYDLARGQRIQ